LATWASQIQHLTKNLVSPLMLIGVGVMGLNEPGPIMTSPAL